MKGCTHIGYSRRRDVAVPIKDFMQEFGISSKAKYSDADAVEIL